MGDGNITNLINSEEEGWSNSVVDQKNNKADVPKINKTQVDRSVRETLIGHRVTREDTIDQ